MIKRMAKEFEDLSKLITRRIDSDELKGAKLVKDLAKGNTKLEKKVFRLYNFGNEIKEVSFVDKKERKCSKRTIIKKSVLAK